MSLESKNLEKISTCLLSHPNKCLKDHLSNVEKLVRDTFPLQDKKIKELALLTAKFHDVGKATFFFQEYMRFIREGRKEEAKRIPLDKRRHALLSAVILYCYLRNQKRFDVLPSFFSFLAVRKHHSFPEDVFEDGGSFTDEYIKLIEEQLSSISNIAFEELGLEVSLSEIKDALYSLQKELKPFRSLRKFKKKIGEVKNFSLYVNFLSIYSSLLFADRKDAAGAVERKIPVIPYDRVKEVIDSIPQRRSIDKKRQEAKESVLSREFNPEKRIYSINLPTGFGKTFTGFLYALKMRKILKERRGKVFRIIYALPFLSIIDQNFEVLKEKLNEALGLTDSQLIMKHHHLTDFDYKTENETLPFDVAKVLTESWESEIVITTLVQLFNAIFPKNRSGALRFSRLSKTIIILDEIQTIPVEYWKLLEAVIKELSEKLDFYVVFMTATKPEIFKEYVELADKKFFIGLNRYNVEIDLRKQTIDEFLSSFEITKGKSHLFILNTVRSSQEFYEKLCEIVDEEVEYISRAVTPFERRERLKKIKMGKVKYLVSTQVVEAGVDIDFDVVVRDFAPFDSLNQSAGRCNRNGEKSGLFKIIRLFDEEKSRFYWSYVYDPVLCSATLDVLKGKNFLTEEDFLNLTEKYFEVIEKKAVDVERRIKPLFEAVKYLRFSSSEDISVIEDINLIRDDYGEEVFIQLNEKAVSVWEQMESLIKRLKSGERSAYKDFLKLKPVFFDYVVKVNLKKKTKPPLCRTLSFYYVPVEQLEEYYGRTGLKNSDLIW
ncbi:CRISPR-associated helicase Cas3' [Desulfurobacterium sp.]